MRQITITQKITKRDSDSLERYFKEVSRIPLLTKEEEQSLSERLINGDQAAKDKLIVSNLRFVISVAKQYATEKNALADLINEGNIGLIESAEKFDPTTGYKFFSYGVWWIRKAIIEYLNKNSRTIRIPINKLSDISHVNKKLNELEQTYSREVSVHELFNSELLTDMNLTETDVMNVIGLISSTTDSLDKPLNDKHDSDTVQDIMVSDSYKDTDHLVSDSTEYLLGLLKELDRNIIIDYLGLNGDEPLTLSEIGDKYGYSREMIRQIKERGLRTLKNKLRKM
jgi:RNA polymerase primary sigma factor